MEDFFHKRRNRRSPQPLSKPLPLVFRIGITVFCLPFFAAGIGIVFAGFSLGGLGVGSFGTLIGAGFMVVPALMLYTVWFGHKMAGREPPIDPDRGVAEAVTASCAYCGKPRPTGTRACEFCGA